MEYYNIIRNDEVIKCDITCLDIDFLKRYEDSENVCIYVCRNDVVVGIIGKKELVMSLEESVLHINEKFSYLLIEDEEAARRIFNAKPMVRILPVLDSEKKVVCEYIIDRDGYYEELVVENGLNEEKRDEKIVVSLTTHGKRLEYVHIAIKSMMMQTCKPDKIVLYLDESSGDKKINKEDELIKAGLTIVRGKENLRPHCKYYYAMQDYPDALLITVDDDIIYPDNVIQDLYEAHLKYPEVVIAHRAHGAFDREGKQLKCKDFLWEVSSATPESTLCATGVGGILYPVGNYREAFLQKDVIKSCSLNADDIWLMYMEAYQGKQVYALEAYPLRYVKHSQEEEGLTIKNDIGNENQLWMNNIEKYLGKTLKDLIFRRA